MPPLPLLLPILPVRPKGTVQRAVSLSLLIWLLSSAVFLPERFLFRLPLLLFLFSLGEDVSAQFSKQATHRKKPDPLGVMPARCFSSPFLKPLNELVLSDSAFINVCLIKEVVTPGLLTTHGILIPLKGEQCCDISS